MAFISASGTGCAARIAGSARSRCRPLAALLLGAIWLASVGATPAAELEVTVAGLRSDRGSLQACLTARPESFPDCQDDPAAHRLTVSARDGRLRFGDLPSGDYALALIHDENGNARLDTRLGIPAEGIGFSRNPRFLFGPPRFAAAALGLTSGTDRETVKVRYFL